MNNLWTYRGRLNRQPYFFRLLAAAVVLAFVKRAIAYKSSFPFPAVTLLILLALTSACLIFGFFQNVQRLHDLDKPGWYALLMLVPLVNFVLGLYLTFAAGSDGPNKYGEDPLAPENAGNGT